MSPENHEMAHGQTIGTAPTSNESNKNVVTWLGYQDYRFLSPDEKTRYDYRSSCGLRCMIWTQLYVPVVDLQR
ncbi:MAG: hypothetical protein ACFFEF_15845 [Candidatus Thorarchaeota archaeon]